MYRIGDYVKCIDNFRREKEVILGAIYKVTFARNTSVQLYGVYTSVSFHNDRFIKANKVKATKLANKMYPEAYKKGDWLYV